MSKTNSPPRRPARGQRPRRPLLQAGREQPRQPFSRDPVNVTAESERAHKQTFYHAFFEVLPRPAGRALRAAFGRLSRSTRLGLRRASIASFEENVRNLKGNTSAIDLLWRGKLLVEHKSAAPLGRCPTRLMTSTSRYWRASSA